MKSANEGDEFEFYAVPYVPDLIEIVGGENRLNADLAIRGLQRLKSKAGPAISVLCTKVRRENLTAESVVSPPE